MSSKLQAPNSPPYFELVGRHEFDQEEQRNILLNFLRDLLLERAFMEYLDKHFPKNEDDLRREKS